MMTPAYNDQNNPQQPKTIKKSTATHHKRKQSKSTQDKIKNGMQRLKSVQNIQQQPTIYPIKNVQPPHSSAPSHTHTHTHNELYWLITPHDDIRWLSYFATAWKVSKYGGFSANETALIDHDY